MEDQAVLTAEPAPAQVQDVETPEKTQPAQPSSEASGKDSQSVEDLLQKGEKDPGYSYTDDELNLLEKHDFKKPEGDSKQVQPTETDSDESESDSEEKVESDDKGEKEESEKDPKIDPELKEALDEVGAKDIKELPAKIKELRKALSGKDAQAVSKLTKDVSSLQNLQQNEINLFEDAKKGVPEALNVMKQRGFVPAESYPQQSVETQQNAQNLIDPDKFIDPESAEQVNSVVTGLKNTIEELKGQMQGVLSERERYVNESASQQARNSVIDEMVKVSEHFPDLKGTPGLREAFNSYLEKGEANPKLAVFDELFDIAEKSGTDIQNALLIKKGRDADKMILEAKNQGQKEAYQQKPNKSLSDVQSGTDGDRQIVKTITDEEIEAMETNHQLMPESWFDKEGEPVKAKVPKKAWKLFW